MTKYSVVIHEEPEGGFWAEVPALPGCYSQGDSIAELTDNVREAIAGFDADAVLEKLRARNLKVQPGGTKESFKFWDPDGFLVQLNGPDYEGHVGN